MTEGQDTIEEVMLTEEVVLIEEVPKGSEPSWQDWIAGVAFHKCAISVPA
jgi:hypothetical protein